MLYTIPTKFEKFYQIASFFILRPTSLGLARHRSIIISLKCNDLLKNLYYINEGYGIQFFGFQFWLNHKEK